MPTPAKQTITASIGETLTPTVGTGRRLSNIEFDITADNSGLEITARGTDWIIEHIAVRGENESEIALRAEVSDEGSARISDVYLADGPTDTPATPTGVAVPASHAGELTIDRVNAQGYQRGIYASPPGNPEDTSLVPGQGGRVAVQNCYVEDTTSGIEIGTPGSEARNCVVYDARQGIMGKWFTTTARYCDVTAVSCYYAGNTSAPVRAARLNVRQSRGVGSKLKHGPGAVDGDVLVDPRTTPPGDCPRSVADATIEHVGTQ